MISILQNFVCTKESRVKLLKTEVPKMSKVFSDFEFYINYNSSENFEEIYKIYEQSVEKLNFYNNLEKNWGAVTLALVEQIKTPYTLIVCEDYEYRINKKKFNDIMKEVVQNDVGYLPIGRLWKYTRDEYLSGYRNGDKLYYYDALNSPGSSLSVDAIYKTELFKEKLKDLLTYKSKNFATYLPHHFEDIFHEPNGVTKWGKNVLCAIPKEIIIMHEQTEREYR